MFNLVEPQKITEARKVRGLNMADLAKKIDVTRQAISRYEQGTSQPSLSVVQKMAKELQMPLEFFYTDSYPSLLVGTTFFRSQKTSQSKIRTIVDIKCNWIGYIYAYLERFLELPPLDLPAMDFWATEDEYTPDDIAQMATFLRRHWNLGNGPIENLIHLLETKGIVIGRVSIDNLKVDACHKKINGRPIMFLGKDKTSCCRDRYSLAHEIGHLLMHSHLTAEDLKDPKILKRIENEANIFASEFLMPSQACMQEVVSPNLKSLLLLKKRWKVSLAAIVTHCGRIKLFSDEQIIALNKRITNQRWRTQEPLDLDIPLEQPQLFRAALNMIFENELQSKNDFLEAYHLPLEDLCEICNVSQNYFKDIIEIGIR